MQSYGAKEIDGLAGSDLEGFFCRALVAKLEHSPAIRYELTRRMQEACTDLFSVELGQC